MPAVTKLFTSNHCWDGDRQVYSLRYELSLYIVSDPITNTYTIQVGYLLDNTNQYGNTIAASNNDYLINYIEFVSQSPLGGNIIQEQTFKVPKITSRGRHLLYSCTFDPIEADDEAEKTVKFNCAHYIPEDLYINSGAYYHNPFNRQWFTVTLDPIMRKTKSTIDGDIILGEEVKVTVTREMVGTNHKVGYNFGGETTWFYEGYSENVRLTLPLELSEYNKTGTTLNMQLVTHTYYGNGEDAIDMGEHTNTYVCNIPESVKPSCTVEVKDGEAVDGVRIFEKYGAYVQRKSRLNVVITPVLAYDSPIVTCTATVNEATYVNEYEFETAVLKYSGEQSITVKLTDKRGRTGEVVIPFNVLEYSKPTVSNVNIYRCDATGKADSTGDYIKVTFNAEITPLNNMNSASYKIEYQTTAGLDQKERTLTDYAGLYSVVNGSCIFSADNNSVYTVVITAIDDFDEGAKTSGQSLATILMNIMASGLGLAFGTTAGIEKVFENAFKFFPSGGFMFPTLKAGDNLYGITTPNIYSVENGQDVEYSPTDDPYTLIVLPGGGAKDLLYIAITGTPEILIARITDSSWSPWYRIGMTEVQ